MVEVVAEVGVEVGDDDAGDVPLLFQDRLKMSQWKISQGQNLHFHGTIFKKLNNQLAMNVK